MEKLFFELLWLTLLCANVVPLGLYLLYMKRVAKNRPWHIKINQKYEPDVSIMVPTYNEATMIKRKLDNISEADYPKEKIEIIVVDGASQDKTPSLAEEWSKQHPEIRTRVICEPERKGMVSALNQGLKYVNGQVVVKTDADCLWTKESLKNALQYLADPQVASVAGLQVLEANIEPWSVKTERTYRMFYNWLRVGESKLYSSVLYEGEFMLLKREVIEKIGFDEEIGGDDLSTAVRVTENGYRAIVAQDAFYMEQTPYSWKEKFRQKIRRGRHVFQALWKYKYLNFREKTVFHRLVLPFETYIYVINPLLTVPVTILSVAMVLNYPWLLLFTTFLLIGEVRKMFVTYVVDNSIMLLAILMETRRKEKVTWQKIEEIRETKSPTNIHN